MRIRLLIFLIMIINVPLVSQVAINEDGSEPDTKAMLDIKSTTKGVLIPRMTNDQIQSISSPPDGLIVYSTDDSKIYFFNSTDNEWKGIDYGTGTLSPPSFPDGTVNCGNETVIEDVINPSTGETWMDRNIGATRVATSYDDSDSYGDLYQWGRFSDGHQCRSSSTTTTISSSTTVGHGNFIITSASNDYDWLTPHNSNLWQGVSGTNNPCPNGYRIPTQAEWYAEKNTWQTSNTSGAFNSILKLTAAGWRSCETGIVDENGSGAYLSSSVYNNYAYRILISSYIDIDYRARGNGYSIRCIKD